MLKYLNYDVVMAEVPDEIALAINITNCPNNCIGCHSPYLRNDVGEELTTERLSTIIDNNRGVTCICFMGGDSDPDYLNTLAFSVKVRSDYPYKVAWYSGKDEISDVINKDLFDYIKVGPYLEYKGPLNKPTTNQIMYKIHHNENETVLENITHKFWNK